MSGWRWVHQLRGHGNVVGLRGGTTIVICIHIESELMTFLYSLLGSFGTFIIHTGLITERLDCGERVFFYRRFAVYNPSQTFDG